MLHPISLHIKQGYMLSYSNIHVSRISFPRQNVTDPSAQGRILKGAKEDKIMFRNPLTIMFIAFLLLFFFFTLQIDLIVMVFARIGIPTKYVFAALFATLIGSFINIPVKRIPQETMVEERRIRFFGFRYEVPVRQRKETVLSVNVGGAVIPVLLSGYLLFRTGLWGKALIATALMTLITFRLARPVPGLGIALPFFVPPILAALASVIISGSHAPVVAYVCGTLGTLIGADLLNLHKIGKLGAPVASIGGAGTFDGIFLNGILAVVLAAVLT